MGPWSLLAGQDPLTLNGWPASLGPQQIPDVIMLPGAEFLLQQTALPLLSLLSDCQPPTHLGDPQLTSLLFS